MDEFIKIAQNNYIRAEAERKATLSQLNLTHESVAKVLEKLTLVTCAVLLVMDTVMFVIVIILQMTH